MPAVRGVTDWKKAAITLSPILRGPNVLGLDHSTPRKIIAPNAIRKTVPTIIIFVCSLRSTKRKTLRCDHISKAAK